jgi:predicted GIY-YIG superfamily endonuclease
MYCNIKMTRIRVDYSKTIIYKIQHITNEDLIYIGATTDFRHRKCAHKSQCNRYATTTLTGRTILYKTIKENGGWDNFRMVEIKKFPCNDKRESDAEEFKLIQEMKATMNYHKQLHQ